MHVFSNVPSRARRVGTFLGAFALSIWLLCGSALAQTTVTSRVSGEFDDMEEWTSTGDIDWNSSDLEMIDEGSGPQIIGLRFPNLAVPAGAYVVDARIQFTADETNNGATVLTIRGEAVDSAASFANAQFGVSGRGALTAASVNWTVNPWNVIQEQGADQRTSNIRAVVQEIIGRAGWKSGNALAVRISGTGKRVAEAYEGATAGSAGHSATQTATLSVTYIIPSSFSVRVNASSDDAEEAVTGGAMDLTSSDLELTEDAVQQYIGMRFTGVNVPKGAVITSAYVQFATDELFSNATSLTLHGQAADNAATFTATAGNISSRALTAASATWAPPAWNVLQEAGAGQRTTDLAAIVQEIVNRSGWNSGNAMVIRVSGTGRRTAEAWDGSAAEAPQLVIRYYTTAPTYPPIGTYPVPKNAVWHYLDNGSDQGTAWRATNFNDTNWAYGPAQLGFGDGDEATVVGFGPNANSKYITTYFRHGFTMTAAQIASIDSLTISLMRDDGAIIYLNGVEITRSNMPAGAVTNTTVASSNVGGTDESRYFTINVGKSQLVAGYNVLAAEVHQDVGTSSDLSFSLGLTGFKSDVKLFNAGSTWKYDDRGTQPAFGWNDLGFDDASWKSGAAPLGYGNGDEATVLSYGSEARFKNMAAYFRRTFTITDTAGFGNLLVRIRRDDGAVVYINGAEVLRTNMRSGPVTYLTPAITWVEGNEESTFLTFIVSRAALRPGANVIAAEVHQNSQMSTDLAFDLELTLQGNVNALTPQGGGTVSCDPATSNAIGCFTSIVPTDQKEVFVYPSSTHSFQKIVKSTVDRYTGSTEALPNGNDFTGYLGRSGSSTRGTISLNHENTPGGVSIIDVDYSPATGLWKTDSITKVDFGPVVTTIRNCSGGITPWGTTITCEEVYNTGDANGDGYHDVGWNVEIDTKTRKIRDFNGDGRPDKLWAVGRMNHENVSLAKDSVTLYEGEDGGTGCVYKFVAARKARLDSGTLYVLKRDNATSTTGTWVMVPNTTQTDRNATSTLAGALGGYRFGGVEDTEIGPDGKIYFTEKGLGDIWRFKDNGTTVTELEKYVSNQNFTIMTENGPMVEPWNVGIDNLAFDAEGNLWGCQDGGRNHIWMIRNGHTPANPKVELFATTPAGSEPTGITFTPDGRFAFLSFQNPSGTNTASIKDATGSDVVFNASTTIAISRRENLGVGAMIPQVELGPDVTACKGSVVTLKYVNRDGQNVWMDNSTDSVLRVSASGVYRLSVIGNNGRVGVDSVRVTFIDPPSVTLGNDRTFCEGEAIELVSDPTLSYYWNDENTSPRRTFSESGQYTVRVTNQLGCVGYDTINIFVNPRPQPRIGDDITICRGASTVLAAADGFTSYLWSDGSRFPKLAITQPGTYWVKVTNKNGCIGYDTVVVRQSAEPSLGDRIEICEGSSAVLTPGNAYASYLWNDGSVAPVLTVNKAGTYWVRVTDQGGCTAVDSVVVGVNPPPSVNLGSDTTVCIGCAVTLDAGTGYRSYRWSNGNTSRSIIVDKPGRYTVTVESEKGCFATDDITVRQQAMSGVDATEIVAGSYSLRAWPNPFTDEATIDLKLRNRTELKVEIYDVSGRRVATLADGVAQAGEHSYTFDASTLQEKSGVYFVKVTVDGKTTTTKLVRR